MVGRGTRRFLLLSNDLRYVVLFRTPLIHFFKARGYEVDVIAPAGDPEDLEELRRGGVTIHAWRVRKTGRNPLRELAAVFQLFALIRKLRPEIVFGYTIKPVIYGMIAARIAGAPRRAALITGLGYAFLPGPGFRHELTRRVARLGYRLALRCAQVAIFQNRDDVELFRAQGLLDARTNARTTVGVVNGSGVDLAQYDFTPVPEGPITFLLVARLLKDKGVLEFVEAARAVRRNRPEARFVLVGAADTNPAAIAPETVQAWVAEGLIEHRGHLRDPRPAYRECHVFVLPSYREGTPRTNLEAMAIGRAIITTDAPGCRETVRDGETGLVVPVRDSDRLAAAMLELAASPKRVREMGLAARRLCEEKFELDAVTRATAELISPGA